MPSSDLSSNGGGRASGGHPLEPAGASLTRRTVVGGLAVGAALSRATATMARPIAGASDAPFTWYSSTRSFSWRRMEGVRETHSSGFQLRAVDLQVGAPMQTIEGFGGCFNELGWEALKRLRPEDRDAVMNGLFGENGTRFSLCRMPIGANDCARGWYSYDETDGDFALANFSIANDETSLIPYIQAAQRINPDLRMWATPWSPPTWMKYNRHYATARINVFPNVPANGLPESGVGREGQDMFIQESRYFEAYARYFGRFIDAYRDKGISIGMVMPQNEFNSAQVFPSCCWTPKGLARFLPYLGREMDRRETKVFFGTLERANDALFEATIKDARSRKVVQGIGLQWAGKGALPYLRRAHPDLPIYQSEQECGDGRNDWRYCRYAWSLFKHYLRGGTSAYQYWTMVMPADSLTTWGWSQNSLVTVSADGKSYRFNPDYWLMKHVSHFVTPGSKRIEAANYDGYDDVLAFVDPAGAVVVVAHNPLAEELPMTFTLGERSISLTLPPDSFNTLKIAR